MRFSPRFPRPCILPTLLAALLASSCGGKVVVDAPTGGGIGGSGSGGTLQSDCEVAAEHLVALGCVPPPVEEFVAVCMEPTPATCAAEYEAWRACFAADIAEVTSCFGDGSSPPSCNSAYCTYCECSGPCQDPSCQ